MARNDFVVSDSGVKVYTPESHPLLKGTDINHPAFQNKLAEIYSRGKVRGLPRVGSENSEDACTWHYFSPLLGNEQMKSALLEQLFQEALPQSGLPALPGELGAKLDFWGKLSPPQSRPQRERASTPDLIIKIPPSALVLVEAKYRSDVSTRTTHDKDRDQVIRLLDVGSWLAKQKGYDRCYVIVLQYGNAKTNAKRMVNKYKGNPGAIKQALSYRDELTDEDFISLSQSVAFVRWPDPMRNAR